MTAVTEPNEGEGSETASETEEDGDHHKEEEEPHENGIDGEKAEEHDGKDCCTVRAVLYCRYCTALYCTPGS